MYSSVFLWALPYAIILCCEIKSVRLLFKIIYYEQRNFSVYKTVCIARLIALALVSFISRIEHLYLVSVIAIWVLGELINVIMRA